MVGIMPNGDAVVVEVRVERVGGVAISKLAECLDLPLPLPPTVVSQLDDGLPGGQPGEQSACGDLRELPRVPAEHGLGASFRHLLYEAGEVAGAGGAGLVDDQHRSLVQRARLAAGDGDQQSGDRRQRDAGEHGEFVSGDARVGGADHPVDAGKGRHQRDGSGC